MRLAFILELRKKDKSRTPHVDKSSLQQKPIQETFANEVSNMLRLSNPDELTSEELSDKIRSVPVAAAQNVLPVKTKDKFSSEFTTGTIRLIQQKRKLWLFLQKSGKRITRSLRETYRKLCRDTKQAISSDRITLLESEAKQLSDTFKQDRFKGYKLLKRQHRSRSKAVMPPEADFTEHYRAHYQLGTEEPLDISSCSLPPTASDDLLSC